MFDERFVASLAAQLAARILPRLQAAPRTQETGRLMTVKAAAVYLGRSVSAVEKLVYRKEIPVVRIGRRVHLDRVELDKWIEQNRM